MSDIDDIFDDFNEEEKDTELFESEKKQVIDRCKKAGIVATEVDGFDDDSLWLSVEMPSGRHTKKLLLTDEGETSSLLSIEFEKLCMLDDYMGICSYSDGIIEASVRPVSNMVSPMFIFKRLFGDENVEGDNFEPITLIEEDDGESPLTISLGKPSEELIAFGRICAGWRSRFSIKISNSTARTHEKALRTLERLANSLFFQIDLKMGIPLILQRERQQLPIRRRGRPSGVIDDLEFPSQEYDQQPMSLYWYAKSARGMPLLQFLAYYQVLEFYMPTYSNHEAIFKVRNILKDPRFSPEKDSQIARILASLRPNTRGFGNERNQFEAVLRRCVSAEELRSFYTANRVREDYYAKDYKSIASQKIPLQNQTSDLLTETALRLYEIRCRIVHTKDDSDQELKPLLPYSKEAGDLYEDIALIEFIATAVLVASSTAIT
jgi:hypothetical protein